MKKETVQTPSDFRDMIESKKQKIGGSRREKRLFEKLARKKINKMLSKIKK